MDQVLSIGSSDAVIDFEVVVESIPPLSKGQDFILSAITGSFEPYVIVNVSWIMKIDDQNMASLCCCVSLEKRDASQDNQTAPAQRQDQFLPDERSKYRPA